MWASHSREPDLRKYLPFWKGGVLLGLIEEQQRGQTEQKTFRVYYDMYFPFLNTWGLQEINCVPCVYVYTVHCKAQSSEIHNLYNPSHLFLYVNLKNWVSFCKYHIYIYKYVCIHWLVNVCVQYVIMCMEAPERSWTSCGLKMTDFRMQLCLLIFKGFCFLKRFLENSEVCNHTGTTLLLSMLAYRPGHLNKTSIVNVITLALLLWQVKMSATRMACCWNCVDSWLKRTSK